MGRKKISIPFNEAKKVVHAERIESVSQYKKWHDLNKPAGIPKRPDRAYLGEFTTWNDYLGNDNEFPIKRRTYRSFNEARAFAQALNISKRQDWFDFCDRGEKPEDIPRRPDLYYRESGQWVSWGNFLGVTLTAKTDTLKETNTIFFIIYNPKAYKNYFRCGLTNGGIASINDFITKINGRVVCAYYVPITFKYEEFLDENGCEKDYDHKGYYHIPSMTPVISKLSINYQKV